MRYFTPSSRFHEYYFKFIFNNYGSLGISLLKRWIDINYRIIRTRSKLQFLKQCKVHNIFPQHLTHFFNISIHVMNYKAVRRYNVLLKKFRLDLIKIEIFDLYKHLHLFNKELLHLTNSLHRLLPFWFWSSILKHFSYLFHNSYHSLYLSHRKKFKGLCNRQHKQMISNIHSIKYTYQSSSDVFFWNNKNELKSVPSHQDNINVFIDPQKFCNKPKNVLDSTNKKWFINLSNHRIPTEVSSLLQLGGKFCLPTHPNKKFSIHEFIKDIECNAHFQDTNKQILIRNIAIPQFYKFIENKIVAPQSTEKIAYLLNMTKKFCKNNKNIIFTKADKGNVTVAMDKDFYINKMEELLNDQNTYTIVTKNPIKSIENNLNNMVKKWLQKEFISKQQFAKLRSSDSVLPRAYGLPKIHKTNTPFRLIVSSVNTALYYLASFLHEILKNSSNNTCQFTLNSFEIYNRLSGMRIAEPDVLISLDVVSLFTNVPLDLAISSVSDRWNHIQNYTHIPKNEFLTAVKFVLTSTYFLFNKIIYKQTYGTPMGSPLSPIIADFVMQDLEVSCLNSINCQITFYHRFVDDIVMAAPCNEIDLIFNTFNEYHDRLKFTIERESERSISFLDLRLVVIENTIKIDWFQKNTYSGRLLSYHSNHPLCHKIGMIYGLIDRALCLSHPSFHQKNIEFIIGTLLDNGYPLAFIFDKLKKRIKRTLNLKKSANHPQNNNNTESGCPDIKKILVIPYINNISEMVASTIDKSRHIVGYRTLNNLGSFVKVHKDTVETYANNNVVYKISCNDCEASYVGQTKRQLKTRVNEHFRNISSTSANPSVITEHTLQTSHSFDWKNVKILDTESNYFKRSISEMIHIKEQPFGLNSQKDTEFLDSAYFDILEKLSKI